MLQEIKTTPNIYNLKLSDEISIYTIDKTKNIEIDTELHIDLPKFIEGKFSLEQILELDTMFFNVAMPTLELIK